MQIATAALFSVTIPYSGRETAKISVAISHCWWDSRRSALRARKATGKNCMVPSSKNRVRWAQLLQQVCCFRKYQFVRTWTTAPTADGSHCSPHLSHQADWRPWHSARGRPLHWIIFNLLVYLLSLPFHRRFSLWKWDWVTHSSGYMSQALPRPICYCLSGDRTFHPSLA